MVTPTPRSGARAHPRRVGKSHLPPSDELPGRAQFNGIPGPNPKPSYHKVSQQNPLKLKNAKRRKAKAKKWEAKNINTQKRKAKHAKLQTAELRIAKRRNAKAKTWKDKSMQNKT